MRVNSISTGITTTGDLTISKGVAALLIATDVTTDNLDDERITIWIERSVGTNIFICTNILLRDFMLMSTYGGPAIFNLTVDSVACRAAMCELTYGGGVKLNPNDRIKVRLDELDATKKYFINGVEEPAGESVVLAYENVTVLTDDVSRVIDVSAFDMMSVRSFATITDFRLVYEDGTTCQYNMAELRALSVDADPFQEISAAGVVLPYNSKHIVLPLVGVDRIEVIKDQTAPVGFVFRMEKSSLKSVA